MDVNGVDVDFLNENEILELFNEIIDNSTDGLSIIEKIDTAGFSENEVEEFYDDLMYNVSDNTLNRGNKTNLNDTEVLSLNSHIVDTDTQELTLINGYNINPDILTDDEIISLYDDLLNPVYIAGTPVYSLASDVQITGCKAVANYGFFCYTADGHVLAELFKLDATYIYNGIHGALLNSSSNYYCYSSGYAKYNDGADTISINVKCCTYIFYGDQYTILGYFSAMYLVK